MESLTKMFIDVIMVVLNRSSYVVLLTVVNK